MKGGDLKRGDIVTWEKDGRYVFYGIFIKKRKEVCEIIMLGVRNKECSWLEGIWIPQPSDTITVPAKIVKKGSLPKDVLEKYLKQEV